MCKAHIFRGVGFGLMSMVDLLFRSDNFNVTMHDFLRYAEGGYAEFFVDFVS